MSVIEAMNAGLAVVATNVGGIPDLVIPGVTGLLVPPGDVRRLADALLQMLSNRDKSLAMGTAGRRRAAEKFDIEIKADRLVRFYHELAGNPLTTIIAEKHVLTSFSVSVGRAPD